MYLMDKNLQTTLWHEKTISFLRPSINLSEKNDHREAACSVLESVT